VRGHALLDGLAQVLPDMKTISYLERFCNPS